MIFLTTTGREQKLKNSSKYLINWDEKCRSKIQKRVKDLLHSHWISDIVFEEFPVVGTRLSIDFYNSNKKIAIEVQGGQHLKYTPHFHGKSKQTFLGQIKRDNDKQEYCKINNIKLVEIYPGDELSISLFESFGVCL